MRLLANPGEDLVVLSIVNGPTLVLNPLDARDLMRVQAAPGTRAFAADADVVAVPAQLGWPGLEHAPGSGGATRGWLGQVLLGAVEVIKGLVVDKAVDIATAAVTRKLDGRVEAGVYSLTPEALEPLKGSGRKLGKLPLAADGAPLLVLVHGISSTPAAPLASCGCGTRRRWRRCSGTTAAVSMRWTIRRCRRARLPTH